MKSDASETNGTSEQVADPVVYIDSNPFIYLIDGEEGVASRVRPIFDLLEQKPGIAATSELTLAEVLAKAAPVARRSYLNLIVWSKLFQLEPVTRDILIDTADYRRVSKKAVKLPDAIHVVTALRTRCRLFLSADEAVATPEGMSVLKPDEFGLAQLRLELS